MVFYLVKIFPSHLDYWDNVRYTSLSYSFVFTVAMFIYIVCDVFDIEFTSGNWPEFHKCQAYFIVRTGRDKTEKYWPLLFFPSKR